MTKRRLPPRLSDGKKTVVRSVTIQQLKEAGFLRRDFILQPTLKTVMTGYTVILRDQEYLVRSQEEELDLARRLWRERYG